nr:hypothetical protein [Tanacetum cinerariifolium]
FTHRFELRQPVVDEKQLHKHRRAADDVGVAPGQQVDPGDFRHAHQAQRQRCKQAEKQRQGEKFEGNQQAAEIQRQYQQRDTGDYQVHGRDCEEESKGFAGGICRLLGLEHHVLQTNHGNQRRGLGQYQPVIGEAGNRQTNHLRDKNTEKHPPAAHAIGHAGFGLPLGNRHECAAKGLRKVRTKNETQRADTGHQWVQVNVIVMTEQWRDAVEQVLTAVENQQNQHQIGNAADHGGIQVAQPRQPAHRRQPQCHADQAEHDRQRHGAQSELQDVEVEVLVLDGFVFAIGTNGRDGCVELVQISLVALAHGNADAVTEVVDVGEGRTDEGKTFTGIGVEEAVLQQGCIRQGAIEATGADVQVDFILRAVGLDFSTQRSKDFLGETLVDRTALHADVLALELGHAITDGSALLHNQTGRGVVVLVGEVDGLLAVFGDGHRGQNGVDLAHFQSRDQAVEFLLDPYAFDFHLFAQGVADVVVETDDVAIRRLRSKWRVCRFDTDFEGLFIGERWLCQYGQCERTQQHELFHFLELHRYNATNGSERKRSMSRRNQKLRRDVPSGISPDRLSASDRHFSGRRKVDISSMRQLVTEAHENNNHSIDIQKAFQRDQRSSGTCFARGTSTALGMVLARGTNAAVGPALARGNQHSSGTGFSREAVAVAVDLLRDSPDTAKRDLGDVHGLVGLHQMRNYTRVGQRGNIAQRVVLPGRNLAQNPAHDFAGTRLRQPRRPLNDIRRSNWTDFLAHPVAQLDTQRLVRHFPAIERDVNVDALPFQIVRHAHYRRFGNLRVSNHGTFDLGGAHTVTGHVEHVVDATGDPVITIFIATGAVTGEVHATERLEVSVDETVVIAVQTARLTRPGVKNHQIAFGRAFDQIAEVIHQRRNHAKERTRSRARLEGNGPRQRADKDAAGFGLPPGVDDRAILVANGVVVPVPGFRVDRLAHRTQQAQARAVCAIHSLGAFGHHCADGGWRGVENIDLVLVDYFRHAGDVRVVRNALEQQRGRAIGQRPVDDVAVAGDPADVSGAPVNFTRAVVEHALMGQGGIQQIACSGVQHALGLAGGAGGVKDEQRLFGAHFLRRASAGGHVQQRVVPDVAVTVPFDIATGALAHDDLLHAGSFRVGQRPVDVGLHRGFLAATQAFVSGDHHFRFAVDDATGQCFRREAAEHHRMNRTDARAGQHGDHGFGDHWHIDGHHIAAMDILAAQCVGEFADFFMQFAVGNVAALGRVVAFPDDGDRITALGQMAVETVVGNVQSAVGEPFDIDAVVVEGGLFDGSKRLDPVKALGLLAPEAIGIDHRLLVHRLVGRLVSQRRGCHFRADGVQGSRTHLSYLGGNVVVLWPCCICRWPEWPFDDGLTDPEHSPERTPSARFQTKLHAGQVLKRSAACADEPE